MSETTDIPLFVKCKVKEHWVKIRRDTREVDIPFRITRRTLPDAGGPARVEARIVPVEDAPFPSWLTVDDDREQSFAADGSRLVYARVRLAEGELLDQGRYTFRLRALGVDDPDEHFAESDDVTVEVTGRKPSLAAYLAIVLVVLGVVAVGLILGMRFLAAQVKPPPPELYVDLVAPPEVRVGEVASYTLKLHNTLPFTVTGVSLRYTLPDGVLGATARIPGSTFRRCGQAGDELQCMLGTLAAGKRMTVALGVVPGPGMAVLSNTHALTVTSGVTGPIEAYSSITTTRVISSPGLSAAILSSVGRAVVREPVTMRFFVWDNTAPLTPTQETEEPLSYTLAYELPQGWRYAPGPLPAGCTHRTYFEIECDLELAPAAAGTIDPEMVPLDLVPTQMTAAASPHHVRVHSAGAQISATAEVALPVAETALYFDGIDDYAELGYKGTPGKSLTVELWVNPLSTDDGQAFIGLHDRQGNNVLLIGYYEGGLHVNLLGARTTVPGGKRAERHHVAVVVEPDVGSHSEVSVFVDGVLQEGSPVTLDRVLDPDLETLEWVLGQDWDRGPHGPVPSDFFHGHLDGVRLWSTARRPGGAKDIQNPFLSVLDDRQEKTLIGYWPLVPDPDRDTETLVGLAPQGRADVPDLSGERHGADWRALPPRSGLTLQFDGVGDVAVPELTLPTDDLSRDPSSAEPYAVTLAAWVYVDEIPSTVQWIVGQAAPQRVTILLGPGAAEWRDVPASELGVSPGADLAQRFQATHVYAIDNGFAGGFPNFHETDYGDGLVYGTILLHPGAAEWRDVPASELGVLPDADIAERFRAANDYAIRNGFVAGFPNFDWADYGDGPVCGTILLRPGAVEWRDLSADQLETLDAADIEQRFRAINDYAVANGFVSGFPNFDQTAVTGPVRVTPPSGALIIDRRGYAAVIARQGLDGGWVELPERRPIPTRRWVHYAGVITYTANLTPELKLYRDGLDVKNATLPHGDRIEIAGIDCPPGVYVGGLCPEMGASYSGRIDDIRIWERALSAGEVPRWLARPGEFYDEVAYWSLDDGPGRQVAQGNCTLDQSCNLRIHSPGKEQELASNDRYHLSVSGPTWVKADVGQTGFVTDGGGQ